eukprot:990547-Pyramimonas_sp.AAC.1
MVTAGIAQGCPLSGSLWAVAMNPFVAHMEEILAKWESSVVGVCADDVGTVVQDRRLLLRYRRVFAAAQTLA